MRVLCIGDQHFQTNNTDEIEKFLFELQKWLENNEVDFIVSMGDLLHQHEKVNVLALKRATDYINMLCRYSDTYIIVGNHDMINSSQFLTTNHWLYPLKTLFNNGGENNGNNKNKKLHIIDNVCEYTIQGHRFVFCPYVPDGRFIEALNRVDNWKTSKCIFGHQTINGAKFGPLIVENTETWESDYPLCVSGHIHGQQLITKITESNLNHTGEFIYVGSIFNSSGDTTKKRLLQLTIEKSSIDLKDIHLQLLQKELLKLKGDEMEEFDLSEYKNKKLRIIIDFQTIEHWKTFRKTDKYKELISNGIKVDPNILLNVNTNIKSDKKNFLDILTDLVNHSENDKLKSIYHNLITNKPLFEFDEIYL